VEGSGCAVVLVVLSRNLCLRTVELHYTPQLL
jgi:hypothetical protein